MSLRAVIPVAGLGTRSLPASKVLPKEMLPVFDRPIIQYVVEEAVAGGATDVIFVTSRGKSIVEDHFDRASELEALLAARGKLDLLKLVTDTSSLIQIKSVRQKEPLGLGHAVLMAERLMAGSQFAVLLADELLVTEPTSIMALRSTFERVQTRAENPGIVQLMEVPASEVGKYGICKVQPTGINGVTQILSCVEKPSVSDAPSRQAIIGRYLLPADIFTLLRNQKVGAIGEIQLTDALNVLALQGRLFGAHFTGLRFDTGDRLGYLKANLHYYLKSSYRDETLNYMRSLINDG